MQNTSPAYDSRSPGHTESGVRIVKEKVRTMACYRRQLHGVTVGKSHVSLPWRVRFAVQITSRSHCGTGWMTGYRRESTIAQECHVDMSVGQKKCFIWNCSRERSKLKQNGTKGLSSGRRTSPRSQWWALHTESFLQEASAEFQKRILAMVCCSTVSKVSHGTCNLEQRECVNRVAVGR